MLEWLALSQEPKDSVGKGMPRIFSRVVETWFSAASIAFAGLALGVENGQKPMDVYAMYCVFFLLVFMCHIYSAALYINELFILP